MLFPLYLRLKVLRWVKNIFSYKDFPYFFSPNFLGGKNEMVLAFYLSRLDKLTIAGCTRNNDPCAWNYNRRRKNFLFFEKYSSTINHNNNHFSLIKVKYKVFNSLALFA